MKLIPVNDRLNLRCYYCGTHLSVKYLVTININGRRIEVPCCNKCVILNDKISADNYFD